MMNNVPALNNLEMIAASGEAGVQTRTPGTGEQEEVKDLFRLGEERNGKSHIRDLSFSASGCIFFD